MGSFFGGEEGQRNRVVWELAAVGAAVVAFGICVSQIPPSASCLQPFQAGC